MTAETLVRCINAALIIVLLLLVRKLIWCVRWLWCYYHGREVPDPIGWLPAQSGRVFDRHLPTEKDDEEEES